MNPAHEIKPGGTRVRATWNGATLAESDRTLLVEGNHYFPLDDVHTDLLTASDTHTHCPWKGDASYYTVSAGGQDNSDAAWYYPTPFDEAAPIKDYVAFWRGVEVAPVS
ncbi:MAG TPA: DUF427 domain-containing protein [Acidimicrobiales bacterium]|nr:DUF427 domain-containing protein [Acidimicrobiales bacterium]